MCAIAGVGTSWTAIIQILPKQSRPLGLRMRSMASKSVQKPIRTILKDAAELIISNSHPEMLFTDF